MELAAVIGAILYLNYWLKLIGALHTETAASWYC